MIFEIIFCPPQGMLSVFRRSKLLSSVSQILHRRTHQSSNLAQARLRRHTATRMTAPDAGVKVIGNHSNFWLYSEKDGFDLTHPETPTSSPVQPRITLQTTNTPITIAPGKTALVIIDMQNFFLSRSLGREGQCHDAEAALLKHALPAARKAGIQVIWLTWGLTEADLESMSPTSLRIFKFDDNGNSLEVPAPGEESTQAEIWTDGGMGAPLGDITLKDGKKIDMGRMMMRYQWNTSLHKPLQAEFEASLGTELPDLRFHKNRISGVCDSSTDLSNFLSGEGKHIKTLLFAGVNIDQCVYGTVQDANLKGWDTILLKDGSGTDNPSYASQMSIDNCGKSWGFVSTCEQLKYGVDVGNAGSQDGHMTGKLRKPGQD